MEASSVVHPTCSVQVLTRVVAAPFRIHNPHQPSKIEGRKNRNQGIPGKTTSIREVKDRVEIHDHFNKNLS